MKKVLCLIIAIFMMLPVNAYAMENQVELNDTITMSDEDMARISGLITSYSINLSKSGSTLRLVANTTGVSTVTKCGLKELIIQKRNSSTSSWENYIVFNDLYSNSSAHSYSNSYTVPSSYQYRATCKHYAKKSLLNTQTIDNTSNIV